MQLLSAEFKVAELQTSVLWQPPWQVTPWSSAWSPRASVSPGGTAGIVAHVVAFRCPCWVLSRDDARAGLPFPVPFPACLCSLEGHQEPTGGGGSLDRRRGGSGCSASPATHGWELPPWRNIPFSNTRPCRGLSRGGGWGSSHAVSKALCCLKCSLRRLMTHSNSWKE